MAVTIHVNGKSNSLAHKGCMGITKSTLPDVCKTPSPGGPVPIPYPVIVSLSNSLKKGSKKVKVDGGNSAAIKGSEYSSCSGDEPGTAGGVKSSANMKEATWILYSFDVKIEGKNACRLSDKMMMNHGNTACLGGTVHKPVIPGQLYWDQTCYDDERKKIHKEQDEINEKLKSRSKLFVQNKTITRKNIAAINCEELKERLDDENKLEEIRNKMMDECFSAYTPGPAVKKRSRKELETNPYDGVSDAFYRRIGHEQAIKDLNNRKAKLNQVMVVKKC